LSGVLGNRTLHGSVTRCDTPFKCCFSFLTFLL
jgi:hypothetical protein